MSARNRSVFVGVIGQITGLVAGAAPIVFISSSELIPLVALSAGASILAPLLSLAAPYRVPTLRTADDAINALAASALTTVLGTTLVVLAGVAATPIFSSPPLLQLLAFVALASGLALYSALLAAMTWKLQTYTVLLARLVYGLSACLAVAASLLLHGSGESIAFATALAYFATVAVFVVQKRSSAALLFRRLGRTSREYRTELRSVGVLPFAISIGVVGSQVGALATPVLGAQSEPWAVVVRSLSAFQTFGSQAGGAAIDVRIARTMRTPTLGGPAVPVRQGYQMGCGLAVAFCAIVALLLLALSSLGRFPMASLSSSSFWLAFIGFGATSVFLSPIGRALGLIGRPRWRLIWDVGRASAVAPLLVLRGNGALLFLAIAGSLVSLSYLWLLRLALSSSEREGSGPPDAIAW